MTALTVLSGCGQIYPSLRAGAGPGERGSRPNVDEVVVGFRPANSSRPPYFAAMEVQSKQIADQQGFKLLFQAANKGPRSSR